MRYLAIPVTLLILFLLGGCILSLYPLYTEEDIVFKPELVGRWQGENGEIWEFSRDENDSYILRFTDADGKTGIFQAHLVELEEGVFLDFYPDEPDIEYSPVYQLHYIGAHSFAYVSQIEPELQLHLPDPGWLENKLEEDPDAIRHEVIDSHIILSASTQELQAFWSEHIDEKEAFLDPAPLERIEEIPEVQPDNQ